MYRSFNGTQVSEDYLRGQAADLANIAHGIKLALECSREASVEECESLVVLATVDRKSVV